MQKPLPDTILRMALEHLNARRALNTLERQMEEVAQYHAPDADVVRGALAFFEEHNRHHAVEDLIYAALKRRAPYKADEIAAFRDDHADADNRLARFAEAVRCALPDVDTARHAFCHAARAFINAERAQIRLEERRFFLYAIDHLRAEDWQRIEWIIAGRASAPPQAENGDFAFGDSALQPA